MLFIPSFNCVVNTVHHVLDLSSSAEVYNAHPENEEANGFDKQTGLKLASKKVILCCLYVDQCFSTGVPRNLGVPPVAAKCSARVLLASKKIKLHLKLPCPFGFMQQYRY